MVSGLGAWQYIDRHRRLKFIANQGLATVTSADGTTSRLYRGSASVPRRLKRAGWVHIGDPDSSQGHVFDAYQGVEGSTSKLYRVTTPAGDQFDYLHPLNPQELFNNSYVGVSPDGQWMVSGEWGLMSRLLMFPTPVLNPVTPRTGGTLEMAGTITLDHPVRNVQGATFVNPTTLLCSSNDPDRDLWPTPRQLLQVELPGPLSGATVQGHVTSLGELPTQSVCKGTFEVEGIDYDATSGDLRVVVVAPSVCGLLIDLYRFRRTTG